jgi:hypothetical protein
MAKLFHPDTVHDDVYDDICGDACPYAYEGSPLCGLPTALIGHPAEERGELGNSRYYRIPAFSSRMMRLIGLSIIN